MIVRHFMTKDVFTLAPQRRCGDVLHELRQRKIRRAPVVESGRLIGLVCESRLLAILPGTPEQIATTAGEHGMDAPVRSIMATPVLTVTPNDHLELAAKIMQDRKIGGLPVLENGAIVGILTESDVFRALVGMLETGGHARALFAIDAGIDVDFAAVCVRHHAQVILLVRTPTESGGSLVDLGLSAPPTQALLAELWKRGCRLVAVERG